MRSGNSRRRKNIRVKILVLHKIHSRVIRIGIAYKILPPDMRRGSHVAEVNLCGRVLMFEHHL
jgi:hypothetical protein